MSLSAKLSNNFLIISIPLIISYLIEHGLIIITGFVADINLSTYILLGFFKEYAMFSLAQSLYHVTLRVKNREK